MWEEEYFLSGLTQKQINFSYMPLGELSKPEVRNIALSLGLPNAKKEESSNNIITRAPCRINRGWFIFFTNTADVIVCDRYKIKKNIVDVKPTLSLFLKIKKNK